MTEEPLILAGERRGRRRPRTGILTVLVVLLVAAATAAVVGLTAQGSSEGHGAGRGAPRTHATRTRGGRGTPIATVRAALATTVGSGSYDVRYEFAASEPAGTGGTGTTTPPNSPITGQGTIDTAPFAMVATSQVPGIGTVTIRENGTDVWEQGGADYGLAGGSGAGPGAPLAGFAQLAEETLGPELGAEGMQGLASPSGYLSLDQSAIAGATPSGAGTVGGVPVEVYRVTQDQLEVPTAASLSAQEAEAIQAADALLTKSGWEHAVTTVSVDAAGYIRRTVVVTTFSDGLVSTETATFSDFGCAGTVLMPGETGPTAPPPGCAGADPATPTTTTTTAPAVTGPTTSPHTVPPGRPGGTAPGATGGDGQPTTTTSTLAPHQTKTTLPTLVGAGTQG